MWAILIHFEAAVLRFIAFLPVAARAEQSDFSTNDIRFHKSWFPNRLEDLRSSQIVIKYD